MAYELYENFHHTKISRYTVFSMSILKTHFWATVLWGGWGWITTLWGGWSWITTLLVEKGNYGRGWDQSGWEATYTYQ